MLEGFKRTSYWGLTPKPPISGVLCPYLVQNLLAGGYAPYNPLLVLRTASLTSRMLDGFVLISM